MWFEKLTGFKEVSPEIVRDNIIIKGNKMTSLINSKSFTFGKLEIITLGKLKKENNIKKYKSKITIEEIIADVKETHCKIENKHALFQAASQFNLLEMVNPSISPEQGIDRYEFDYTQGPACAISCGAGTIYRNYFAKVNERIGQTYDNQINCLDLIEKEFNNNLLNLWKMRNGYVLLNQDGILSINKKLSKLTKKEKEDLKEKLKVGIQWNTEVTKSKSRHTVSQIYCSALPVAYNNIDFFYWENFSRLILEATYEATLYAGVANMKRNKSNKVFLTLVGGGAFGNEECWILESMMKAVMKFRNVPLDIKVISYGKSKLNLLKSIERNFKTH